MGCKSFLFLLVLFCVVAPGAKDCALVVNLRACGLAFEDAATNPVTLSEERSEREERGRGEGEGHTGVSGELHRCWFCAFHLFKMSPNHIKTFHGRHNTADEEGLWTEVNLKEPFRWKKVKQVQLPRHESSNVEMLEISHVPRSYV